MTKTELKEIARISEDAKNAKKPVCLIFNSEVTVHLRGSGKGGPCQETALATAIYLKQRHRQHEALQVLNTHKEFSSQWQLEFCCQEYLKQSTE